MAQKDYVARSQKKKQPLRKKKDAAQSIAWVKVVFAILVVGAFAFGLWQLKDAGSEKDVVIEQDTQDDDSLQNNAQKSNDTTTTLPIPSDPAKSVKTSKDALPTLEDEEWEFIEGLPAYSVEVDTNELADSGRLYKMQCASFRTAAQAEALRAKIALQGLEAIVEKSKNTKSVWYQVFLGPYKQKRLADKDKGLLKAVGITGCQVWNWE